MFSKYEGIANTTLSRNMLGKSMNSVSLLMNGIFIKCQNVFDFQNQCKGEEHVEYNIYCAFDIFQKVVFCLARHTKEEHWQIFVMI